MAGLDFSVMSQGRRPERLAGVPLPDPNRELFVYNVNRMTMFKVTVESEFFWLVANPFFPRFPCHPYGLRTYANS